MWLNTKTEYAQTAMNFAKEKAPEHYDRMGYGDSSAGIQRRQANIYIGKIAEYTICEYLENELGLDIIRGEGNGADLFDFKVRFDDKQLIGDIKSFHIYSYWNRKRRTREDVETESLALVPADQYERQKDLYIFAMVFGDSDMPRSPHKTGDCFVKWATYEDIIEWRYIDRQTPTFPYSGTRTNNYGKKMSECRAMESFLQDI